MTSLEAAQFYVERGLWPIPIPIRQKAPSIEGWPALRLAKADLDRYFNGVPSNIGVTLGDDYGSSDVDLDCKEAIAVAGEILPETGMCFGRKSKPRSHYFYRCDPPIRSKRYLDPIDKACLIELRCRKSDGSVGLQTVVPPSVHPEGEQIRFEPGGDGHPANIDAPILQEAVAKVAAAALLARHWPGEKSGRNETFLALAGALARGGWTLDEAITFHRAIYRVLWGAHANIESSAAEVRATFEKHSGGHQTTGKRSLEELIEKRAVRAALSWLGISQPSIQVAARVAVPNSMSLEDLMDDTTITVPELLIEGLLPRCGLVLLGGRPKDGKSWWACQLGLSLVTGESLGGWLRVRDPGRCQLWALEDQFALTKDKIAKLLCGNRPDSLRDLRVFSELPQPLLRGGDQIIRAALDKHPAELVILDSLFKLTGHQQPNQDISQRDYDVIDRARKIALDYRCAVVIVMHTKKGSRGGDPIENLLGTSGNTAAADVVCELKRTGHNGKLTVTGRMVQREDYELVWHEGDKWGWTVESAGDDASVGETSDEVMAFLEAQGAAKPASIAAGVKKSFGAVWMSLKRLQDRGRVVRGKDKKWDLVR